jgi:hypothetical protein
MEFAGGGAAPSAEVGWGICGCSSCRSDLLLDGCHCSHGLFPRLCVPYSFPASCPHLLHPQNLVLLCYHGQSGWLTCLCPLGPSPGSPKLQPRSHISPGALHVWFFRPGLHIREHHSLSSCPPSSFLGPAFPVVAPRCLACLVLPTRSAMMRFPFLVCMSLPPLGLLPVLLLPRLPTEMMKLPIPHFSHRTALVFVGW